MGNIKEKSQIIFQSELFLNYTEENTCIIIWFLEKKRHKTTYILYTIQLMKIVHVRNSTMKNAFYNSVKFGLGYATKNYL